MSGTTKTTLLTQMWPTRQGSLQGCKPQRFWSASNREGGVPGTLLTGAPACSPLTGLSGVTGPDSSFGAATFVGLRMREEKRMIEFRQVASGGRCQWVLDATRQVVEWLCQPLRFESVVLRTASRLALVCYNRVT